MQIEFSKIIQAKTDAEGGEITPQEIWAVFRDEYLPNPDNPWGRIQLKEGQSTTGADGVDTLTVEAAVDGEDVVLTGSGNGPISAFFDALQSIGVDVRLLDYQEHTMSEGASAQAASYIECAIGDKVLWGIGIDANTTRASLKAVVSAVNRASR
jgi:2-isopropylmalate synthase